MSNYIEMEDVWQRREETKSADVRQAAPDSVGEGVEGNGSRGGQDWNRFVEPVRRIRK